MSATGENEVSFEEFLRWWVRDHEDHSDGFSGKKGRRYAEKFKVMMGRDPLECLSDTTASIEPDQFSIVKKKRAFFYFILMFCLNMTFKEFKRRSSI